MRNKSKPVPQRTNKSALDGVEVQRKIMLQNSYISVQSMMEKYEQ